MDLSNDLVSGHRPFVLSDCLEEKMGMELTYIDTVEGILSYIINC